MLKSSRDFKTQYQILHTKAEECENIAIMSMFGFKLEHIMLYSMMGSSCLVNVSWHNIVLYRGWLKVLVTSFVFVRALRYHFSVFHIQ